ncbi:hypothetical protein FOCC_FOCC011929 [Frankliniella occidentalis]|nr:hypothetical protein FOCC_FOCC011929 [Frankliniella occidentalis]
MPRSVSLQAMSTVNRFWIIWLATLVRTLSTIVHTDSGAAFLLARRRRSLLFVEESESLTKYQRPLYTVHFIVPNTPAAGKRPSWRGPNWLKGFYSFLFTQFKFNKGHLVPRANMTSREDQEMTMELEDNIVPIDMAVNAGNMEAVEKSLRNLADQEGELVEYTGWLGELYLCSIEDAIVEIEKFVRDRGETTTIEEIKKYIASCNGRISVPKYLYKLVLRKDTYKFVSCTVISNDVNQATDDPTLPKVGPKPKGMKNVAWNDPKKGLTRWLTEEEFYKWSKEHFPDDFTPQKCIKDARKDKSRQSKGLTFDTMSPVNFEEYMFPMQEKNIVGENKNIRDCSSDRTCSPLLEMFSTLQI